MWVVNMTLEAAKKKYLGRKFSYRLSKDHILKVTVTDVKRVGTVVLVKVSVNNVAHVWNRVKDKTNYDALESEFLLAGKLSA